MLGYYRHLLLLFIYIGFIDTVFTTSCYGQGEDSAFQSKEKELIKCLTSDLDPNVRPVKTANETVDVTFSVATIAINDLDEKNHLIKMKGWLFQMWKDPQLTWDKSQYGGIDEIRLPANKIWTPDIVLYNYEDTLSLFDYSHSIVVVKSDGSVFYVPLDVNVKASCPMDFSHFPYDRQQCVLTFGSWTNPVTRVNLTILPNDTTSETWYKAKEWEVWLTEIHQLNP